MRALRFNFVLMFTMLLLGCNAADTITNGMKHTEAISKTLLEATGEKPFIGFNWSNGTLHNINIMFDKPPQKLTLAQIKQLAKTAVAAQFKQQPEQLIISFSFNTKDMPD